MKAIYTLLICLSFSLPAWSDTDEHLVNKAEAAAARAAAQQKLPPEDQFTLEFPDGTNASLTLNDKAFARNFIVKGKSGGQYAVRFESSDDRDGMQRLSYSVRTANGNLAVCNGSVYTSCSGGVKNLPYTIFNCSAGLGEDKDSLDFKISNDRFWATHKFADKK